jgi:asparagine synthase (glutamine-hydrolysing)
VGLPERLEATNLLHGYGSAAVFEPAFLARVDPTAPAAALSQRWWLADGCSQVNQLIALDLKYALADRQLPATMRACEMAGMEAAFPFLGDAVMAFAARLSPHQKLDGVRLVPCCDALRATLPRKAAAAATRGAGSASGCSRTSGRSLAFDSLSDLKRRAIVRADFIDALLSTRVAEQPAYHGRMVWLLTMLEQWLAQRRISALRAPIFRRAEDEPEACRQ